MRTFCIVIGLVGCLTMGLAQSIPSPAPDRPAQHPVEQVAPDSLPSQPALTAPAPSSRPQPAPSVYTTEQAGNSSLLHSLLRMFLRLYE